MNNFTFTISAVDNVTKNIKRINDNIDRMLKPIRRVQNSVKSMTKEAGLDRFGKSMKDVASQTGKVAENIRSITAPLAAVIGVGTVAGIADLATQWGRFGNSLTQNSSVIGISTNDLQELQGAAKMAGLSTESMTSSLRSLGDTMNDAVNGRNQEALMVMNKIGLTLHRTKSGAVDTARAMRDLADAVSSPKFKGNVQAQAELSRIFGVEPMLYLLQKGRRGIDEYVAEARKLGYIMSPQQIAAAEQYNRNMMAFEMTLSSLRNTIGDALIPTLQPLLNDLTKWVSAHKQLIATKIDEFVHRISDAIKNTNWDQWKMGMIGVAAVLGSGLAANVLLLGWAIVKLTTSLGTLIKLAGGIGMTGALGNIAALGAQATLLGGAGLVGWEFGKHIVNPAINWLVEKATGEKGQTLGGLIYEKTHKSEPVGILQNNPGNLRKWGNHLTMNGFAVFKTPGEGITAMAENLRGYQNKYGLDTLNGIISRYAPSSENDTAAYIADVSRHTGFKPDQRLNLNDRRTLAPLVSAMIRHENGKNPYTNAQIDQSVSAAVGAPQQVKVEVAFKNAPPGTRATAKNEKGHDTPIRVAQSMNYAMP